MSLINTLSEPTLSSINQTIHTQREEIQALKTMVMLLEKTVAEEQEAKYRAYIRVADLQKEAKSTQVHPTQ
jgi:hypothetical protein